MPYRQSNPIARGGVQAPPPPHFINVSSSRSVVQHQVDMGVGHMWGKSQQGEFGCMELQDIDVDRGFIISPPPPNMGSAMGSTNWHQKIRATQQGVCGESERQA